MHELVELVNRHVPVPPATHRRRLWVCVGDAVAFRGGVVLRAQRARDDETHHLLLHFSAGAEHAALPHSQMFRIGSVDITPRALATRAGVPLAVLLELTAEPHNLSTAIEVAA
jgi:hypothetical protein